VQLAVALDGRKRMRGRLLGIGGAAGAERVQMEVIEKDEAAPPRKAGAARSKRAVKRVEVPGKVVEFALADVDKARLVPELNFRSQR
jgi:ribosome maturation factor RimP